MTTVHAYRLQRIFLNGWVDFGGMIDSIIDIDEGESYVESWRERIRNRLQLAVRMFQDMGWGGTPEGRDIAWFAPLPAADGPLVESEFLIAIDAEDSTYVASPYELPWLTNGALGYRRSEMMVEPPSMTRN